MRLAVASVLLLAGLMACGPVSPGLAANQCEQRARQADGPFGEAYMGGGSGGFQSSMEVGITSDYVRGLDPERLYANCVRSKTGRAPIRPYVPGPAGIQD